MAERPIDLGLLRCLDALIVECSVTLAARKLGMSQSGMSNALARLRDLLHDPILIRTSKGMAPTARALQLAPVVRAAIDNIGEIVAPPGEFQPQESTAAFRLASGDGAILAALEPVIQQMQETASGLQLEITALNHGHLQEPLENGTIDLALGAYADLSPTLYHTKVLEDPLCCVVSRNGIHAGAPPSLESYCGGTHAIVSRGFGHRSGMEILVDRSLAPLGVVRKAGFSAPYAGVVMSMVARTNMLAACTRMGARMYASHLPLEIHPLPFEVPPLCYAMVWHERMRNNAALAWVRQMLREGMLKRAAGEYP